MSAPGGIPAPAHNPLRAALWMTGAITSFSAMAIAVRELKGAHDTFEIMAVRSAVGLLIVLAAAFATGRLHEVSAQRLGGHVLRNAIHFTGQNLWILAVTLIPLAQVFALEFTTPIWVLLLSPFFLGERITPLRMFAAVLGFLGILVVARPDVAGTNTGGVNLGMAAAAASAVCFALTGITTKVLTRHEGTVSIMFWLTLLQLVFGIATSIWDGVVHWPTATSGPWLVVIGVTGVVAHFCLTSALQLAPASFVMPIDFARLPLIAVAGAVLYGEAIDAAVLVGATIIFAGNYLNVWSETRRQPH
jgi:drug/metabolite transporter (DMT)-like permease